MTPSLPRVLAPAHGDALTEWHSTEPWVSFGMKVVALLFVLLGVAADHADQRCRRLERHGLHRRRVQGRAAPGRRHRLRNPGPQRRYRESRRCPGASRRYAGARHLYSHVRQGCRSRHPGSAPHRRARSPGQLRPPCRCRWQRAFDGGHVRRAEARCSRHAALPISASSKC